MSLLAALQASGAAWSDSPHDVKQHAVGADVPGAVAWPESEDSLATFLRECTRAGLRVAIFSAAGSCPPPRGAPGVAVAVSLARFPPSLVHEPDDLVLKAGASAPLASIGACAWMRRQSFGAARRGTLGSALSTGRGDASTVRYGPMRDRVLGLRGVLADGSRVAFGGAVVKNVAGYDVVKLLVGSRGTLVAITEATLRLWGVPSPVVRATGAVAATADLAAVAGAIRSCAPLAALLAHVPDGWRFDVRLAGSGAVERARAALGPLGALVQEADGDPFAAMDDVAPGAIRVRFSVPWAAAPLLARDAVAAGGEVRWAVAGVVAAGFEPGSGVDLLTLRKAAERSGGSMIIDACEEVGDAWGTPPPGLDLMRRMKRVFDPTVSLPLARSWEASDVAAQIFIDVVLPVFLVAGLAYVVARWRKISPSPISNLSLYLFNPALSFSTLTTRRMSAEDTLTIVGYVVALAVLTLLAVWLVARVFRLSNAETSAYQLSTAFMNAGNFGIPMSVLAFGEEGLQRAIVFFVVQSTLAGTLAIFIASRGGSGSWRTALQSVLRTPIVYAAGAAWLVVGLGVQVPGVLATTTGLLGGAALPVMLAILGIQLAQTKLGSSMRGMLLATGGRLVLGAAVAVGLAVAFGLRGVTRDVMILQASMPTAVFAAIVAEEYKAAPEFVTGAVMLSTVGSLATVTIVLALLRMYPS